MFFYLFVFFLQGARLKTLPAIIIPIVTASALALHINKTLDFKIFLYSLFSGIFLQMSVNFANDAMDFKTGVDTSLRKGPLRLSQTGRLSVRAVLSLAVLCSLISFVIAIPLILKGGLPVLIFSLVALALCYCYTGFSFSLINLGLAELVCFLFFGPVAVIATYYIQTSSMNSSLIYLGLQCGFWALSILLVNYLRDEQEDKQSGRKNIVTVYGRVTTLFVLGVIQICLYLFCFYWMNLGMNGGDGGALSFFVIIPSCVLFYFICNTPPSSTYNKFLFFMSMLYVLFSSVWIVGLL